MENICGICKEKLADVVCYCDNSSLFCFQDYVEIHLFTEGQHKPMK